MKDKNLQKNALQCLTSVPSQVRKETGTKSDQYQALLKMPSGVPSLNKQNNLTIRASLCQFHLTDHIISLKITKQLSDCFTDYTIVEWWKLDVKQKGLEKNPKPQT